MRFTLINVVIVMSAVAAAAVFCLAAAAPDASRAAKVAVKNPHWQREACASCHDMSSGAASPLAADKIDELCFSCHDGHKAHAEVHPTHRKFPATQAMHRPESWPLSNGELGCNTCHDSKVGCDLERHVRADNPNLLRSNGGRLNRGKKFCASCHLDEAYPKLNPHFMLTNDGHADESRCVFCHAKAPDPKIAQRTFEPDLKASQSAICQDCHPRHRDPLVQMHIGLRVTPDEQAYMCAVEAVGLVKKPPADLIAKYKGAGARPTLLIPAKDGTIVCSTCHNPHQAGLFAADSKLAFAAMPLDRQKKLSSPVREEFWCRRCHAN